MGTMFPEEHQVLAKADSKLKTMFSPIWAYAYMPGMAKVAINEPGWQATLRLQTQGTRQVCVFNFQQIANFLLKFSEEKKEHPDLDRILSHIGTLDSERLAAMANNGVDVFAGEVNPNDMLYTPMGSVICERCVQSKNAGFRISVCPQPFDEEVLVCLKAANMGKLADALLRMKQ